VGIAVASSLLAVRQLESVSIVVSVCQVAASHLEVARIKYYRMQDHMTNEWVNE
jgi:hypothetical protein